MHSKAKNTSCARFPTSIATTSAKSSRKKHPTRTNAGCSNSFLCSLRCKLTTQSVKTPIVYSDGNLERHERKIRTTEWRSGIFTPTLQPFTGPESRGCNRAVVADDESITPIQCFRLFFTSFMGRLMVKETKKLRLATSSSPTSHLKAY